MVFLRVETVQVYICRIHEVERAQVYICGVPESRKGESVYESRKDCCVCVMSHVD